MVAGHYTDDALAIPPNHAPIRGKTGILAYFKGARDAAGEFDGGNPLSSQATTTGNLLSLVGDYSFRSGKLRFTSHELYQRQSDGSVRCTVDMFGFRDPT
jgi:ketosteroid isomerase-like protein